MRETWCFHSRENLSPASYADLKDYFDLFLRKAKRQSEKQGARRFQ